MADKRTPIERNWEERQTEASRLADSQFYRALAATERRRILRVLLDREACTVDEVVEALGESTDSQLRAKLRHIHLPLLEDVGLVNYDQECQTVTLAPLEPLIEELIRLSAGGEREALA